MMIAEQEAERHSEERGFMSDPDFQNYRTQQALRFAGRDEYRSIKDGIYTVEGPSFEGSYRTLKIETLDSGNLAGKTIISYLSGNNNDSDYTGCAFLIKDEARTVVWKKFRGGRLETEVHDAVNAILGDPMAAGQAYARRSGKCFVCNRTLTTPESIAEGIGPVCAEKYSS